MSDQPGTGTPIVYVDEQGTQHPGLLGEVDTQGRAELVYFDLKNAYRDRTLWARKAKDAPRAEVKALTSKLPRVLAWEETPNSWHPVGPPKGG